jgi:drug/metabolite transporter (DMT)-like permease
MRAQVRSRIDVALLLAFTAVALWALNVPVMKGALDAWSPMAFSFARFGAGALIYAGWVLVTERSLRIRRRHIPLFVIGGVVGIAINNYTFMYALEMTTASIVTLVFATTPLWAALMARVLGWEIVKPLFWIAVLLSGVGVFLVLIGTDAEFSVRSVEGILLAFGAPLTWGVYSVLVRPLLREYSASHVSAVMMLIGAPLLGIVGLPQLLTQEWTAFPTSAWVSIAYAIVASLVVANLVWFLAINRTGSARVVSVMPLQPFLGVIFAYLLLGERLGWVGVVGGGVIVVGVALAIRSVEPVPTAEVGTQD